ncbi:MAG: hypothetical protein HC810_06600, partial [Acaryochloridaceae cyanobacterium RL_2_7]|nr:hypothetical protein [Acaryochloridaceae cyanobacterium RL_2_7]
MSGVDVTAIRRSPRLRHWLSHELRYGQSQRIYSRAWFSYLSGQDSLDTQQKSNDLSISCDEDWQVTLQNQLAEELWNWLSDPTQLISVDPEPVKSWKSVPLGKIDPRFSNCNALDIDIQDIQTDYKQSSTVAKLQLIYQLDFQSLTPTDYEVMHGAYRNFSVPELASICQRMPRLKTIEP